MKTKPFQTLLKIWIALASIVAFLFGWAVLGHSGKPPVSSLLGGGSSSNNTSNNSGPAQIAPLPTLAPLPPIGSSQGLQPLPAQPQPSFNFPMPSFRTRGS